MKSILKLEELAMWIVCLYALYLLDAAWWLYLVMLIGPDISFLGYIAGNKIGAVIYNLFHHKGIAVLFFLAGLIFHNEVAEIIGIVLFGHSSQDRLFGYGLKYFGGFQFTHLGKIGKQQE